MALPISGQTLVDALAERHGVDSARIVVGGGSVALISHLVGTVCDEGDDVVMPWRSFEAYPICVTAAGARPLCVPLTVDGRHDVPALLEAVTPRTRLLMACTPNNPTGAALSAVELQALLDGVPEDVAVLVDEACVKTSGLICFCTASGCAPSSPGPAATSRCSCSSATAASPTP